MFLVLFLGLTASCGRDEFQGTGITLQGLVDRVEVGGIFPFPVQDATVQVAEIDGLIATTGVDGRYQLSGIPIGEIWTVIASDQNLGIGQNPVVCTIEIRDFLTLVVVSATPSGACRVGDPPQPGVLILDMRLEGISQP